jgi:hypothetical protein
MDHRLLCPRYFCDVHPLFQGLCQDHGSRSLDIVLGRHRIECSHFEKRNVHSIVDKLRLFLKSAMDESAGLPAHLS